MSLYKKIVMPSVFSMALLLVRVAMTGEFTYIFLAWNLFLAWIPYWISCIIINSNGWNRWRLFSMIFLWLLFLPNAPYIITDFLHLRPRFPVPYWYDILLLFSVAMNGLLLGILSLVRLDDFLTTRYGKTYSGLIIFCALFLSAFGIYLGRFLRWNSWDIFFYPDEIAGDILVRILNPLDYFKTWAVTSLFGSFLYISYYSIKNFINHKPSKE